MSAYPWYRETVAERRAARLGCAAAVACLVGSWALVLYVASIVLARVRAWLL